MGKLDGKVALVTGASRGIGRAIALRLAHDGAFVIVHYGSNAAAALETLAMIEAAGGQGITATADLRDPFVPVQAMFEFVDRELIAHTGRARLDILVNNAGHLVRATIEETSCQQFDEAFGLGVKAAFFVTRAALPRMGAGGRVINISSGTVRIATPGAISYAMAKGALDVFSRTLAQHLGPRGIAVNSVAPGLTATEELLRMVGHDPDFLQAGAAQSAFNRIAQPDDIAAVVAFVASDDSRWVTGQVIDATGGAC